MLKKKKIQNALNKIPVEILGDLSLEDGKYFVEIKKSLNFLKSGDCYLISIDLLQIVSYELWNNLLKE